MNCCSVKIMAKSVKGELAMRKALIAAIKNAETAIDSAIDSMVWHELDERQKKLQSDYQKFESKSLAILGMDAEIEKAKFEKENEEMAELCVKLKAKVKQKMAQLDAKAMEKRADDTAAQAAAAVGAQKNAQQSNVIEKKVEGDSDEKSVAINEKTDSQKAGSASIGLPSLRFSIPEWHHFEKEFDAKVMKNEGLNDDLKLTALLIACEQTEAGRLLARLGERNVATAFNELKETFGTSYAQADYFTQALLSIPNLSAKSPQEYLSLVNSVDYCIAGLNRHIENENCVHLIPFMVLSKLDCQTRSNWERYRSMLLKTCDEKETFLPDWCTMKGFLQDEAHYQARFNLATGDSDASDSWHCDGKSTAETKAHDKLALASGVKTQAQSDQAHASWQSKPNLHCDCDVWHRLHKCPDFLAMTINQREKYIRDRNVCGQCLLTAHMGVPCEDPKANQYCYRCSTYKEKVKHNSMLCKVTYNKVNNIAIVTPANSQAAWNSSDDWNDA